MSSLRPRLIPPATLADPDLPFWLALNRVTGIGPSRFRTLIESFGTAGAAWRATPAAWQAAGIDSRTTAAFATQRRSISPEAERDTLVKLRVGLLLSALPAGLPLGVSLGAGVVAFLVSVFLHQRHQWLQGRRNLGALPARFPSGAEE